MGWPDDEFPDPLDAEWDDEDDWDDDDDFRFEKDDVTIEKMGEAPDIDKLIKGIIDGRRTEVSKHINH